MPVSSNVTHIPVWKKDATPEERFLELAQMASENPERFEKVIVSWMGTHKGKPGSSSYITAGCGALEALGLATLTVHNVKQQIIE